MFFGIAAYDLLAWFLAAFFLIGGIGNWLLPGNVRADYKRWGYPSWFHRVTAVLEIVSSVLLAVASVRIWGIALGSTVMLAAIATLLRHKEFRHALLPSTVLLLLLVLTSLTV